jgi:hypothetical protein
MQGVFVIRMLLKVSQPGLCNHAELTDGKFA